MILENQHDPASTNVNNSSSMKIEANHVMYSILSDKIYSDKPLATLRELSTNAIDSHIEAGKTAVPIKVHLPTRLEPFLSVTDEGIGMSKETVDTLYNVLGASTKRNSNLANGCLGIGKISALSYASSFTVTSVFHGVETVYSVYLNDGIPTVSELGDSTTTKCKGVTVTVPVQTSDIQKFTDSALKLYKYFNVKPEVNISLDLKLGNVLYEGTGWKIYDKTSVPVVVMANVAYPLDRQQINGMQALQSQGLVIYADTGAVQFAASRESLSYTPSTIDYLKKINDKIVADLTEYVKEIPRKFEGKLLEMQHNLASLPSFLRNIVYRQDIHKYIEKSNYFEIHNSDFKWLIPKNNTGNYSYTEISWNKLKNREVILADSLPAANAVAQHLKDRGVTTGILAFTAQRTLGTKAEATAKMKEFADLLGVPYKIASEESLKIFGTTVATGKGAVATSLTYRASGFKYDPNSRSNYYYLYSNGIAVSAKDKTTTIGIPIYNGKFQSLDYTNPMDFLYQDIWNILEYTKYPTTLNVVAIPKTHKEHLQNTIDLYTFLKTLGTLEIDVVTKQLISELLGHKNYSHSYIRSLQLPQDFKDYILEVDELKSKPQEQYNHQVIHSANKIGVPTKVKELGLTAKAKEAHERYKPLNICTINNDITKQQHFVKLVNALSKDK